MPSKPIYLDTDPGRELIARADRKTAFWALAATFETQQTQTLCGAASSVTVLNALHGLKAVPVEPIFYPYPMFTQLNFFSQAVSEIKQLTAVLADGMTLDQLARALTSHGAAVKTVHADKTSADGFREVLSETLARPDRFLIANFDRPKVGQKGGGHFSPLAAWDRKTDRVLVLDVARYKYKPAWVTVGDLYAAMDTKDSDSKKARGYLLVGS